MELGRVLYSGGNGQKIVGSTEETPLNTLLNVRKQLALLQLKIDNLIMIKRQKKKGKYKALGQWEEGSSCVQVMGRGPSLLVFGHGVG